MGDSQTSNLREQAMTRGRFAVRHALVASGLRLEDAMYWCAAWEVEAERQGLQPDSRYYWDAGTGWIDAQRSFDRVSISGRGQPPVASGASAR